MAEVRNNRMEKTFMAYRKTMGEDPRHNIWCNACRLPITEGEPSTRVEFQTDPDGKLGLSGTYHTRCSRPFQSLARVVNLNPWARF
jgi:hypothetical protein